MLKGFTPQIGQANLSTMDDSNLSRTIKDRVRRLVSTRLERSERILAVLQIGLILTGGFAAGIAQIMPETKDGAMPWREILGYGGAAFALVGGSLLWWLQYSAPEELNAAFAAVDQLETDRRMHDEKTSELTQLFERAQIADDQRAQLAVAVSNGISIVDDVIAADTKNLKKDVEQVLTACLPGLLAGMGLSMADNYCISVFERRPFKKTEKMFRFAERRPGAAEKPVGDSRSWAKGSGFTGHAWQTGNPVLIDNSGLPHWRQHIKDVTEGDTKTYCSVASFLIWPGRDQGEPWGALTVTSNKANCFGPAAAGLGAARGDAVNAIAKILAILVAARYLPALKEARL